MSDAETKQIACEDDNGGFPVKTMRILHIIGTLDPAAGGPTESVRVLLTFGPIGYTGEVVTLDAPDAPYLQGLPFPVHGLGPHRMTYGFNWKLLPWLRANRHRFDGVVINGLWQYCGLAAWLALRGKTPYVVFTHGMLDPWFKHTFPWKHLKKWVYWILVEYWILRSAYRVLFTTVEESRLAKASFWLHHWNAFVVPYGAARPPQDEAQLKAAFCKRCPETCGRPFVLFLGRIHRKKGCDHLVEAFARIASEDKNLQLLMAGPDQQGWQGKLRKIAANAGVSDRVHWPGMLHGDAKWGSFLAAEVFILPSHQENFGIAVAEALACGCAVLLSDKVNIAAEISSYGAGIMETDTLAGTESLLRRWLAMTADERSTMKTRAKACFEERYDMRRNAETIIRLFEDAGIAP